jgi:hypothetical protein
MPVSRFVRQWFPEPEHARGTGRPEHTVAVLEGARSVVRRGWIQGGWYVLEATDGRRRVVGPGSLTPRSFGAVVQACLVGAAVEAARWHSAERGAAGPAIDALWRALMLAEGKRFVPERLVASPAARTLRVRDLTRWNDDRGRTRDQVLALLDAAVDQVLAERAPADALLVDEKRPDRALVG